jgi:signal transduction histidine kinase
VRSRRNGCIATGSSRSRPFGVRSQYQVGILLWDITDDKQLQDELIQAEKLSSLGTMVSGMAHEINNPAQAILSMAELIQDEDDPDTIKQFAADIVGYARHVSTVVRDFAGYARAAGRDGETEIDVAERLLEAVKMVRRGPHFGHVEIATQFDAPVFLRARKGEIDQVFVNLISNAIQAMEGIGCLTLATGQDGRWISGDHCRYRSGHPGFHPPEDFRSVLHHQNSRQRDGTRTQHRAQNRDQI